MEDVRFDRAMIDRYDISGPRYTSYPTVLQFSEGVNERTYREVALASNRFRDEAGRPRDLSLYFHIPFCAHLCYYCACSKIVTRNRSLAAPYLDRLEREIERHAQLYADDREVAQLHWGGGTPTFISDAEARHLMACARRHFRFKDDAHGEYSIEIDPREVREATLETLRAVGFNRMSLGVQDFEPAVQKAVNRIQSEELTGGVMNRARSLGFRSINVDLIYGLPFQTLQTMDRTLAKVIALDPDRISIYNYAHLPERFPPQVRLRDEDMPGPDEKLDMLKLCIDRFADAGYAYIGMDHFAKKTDALYRAQQAGTLYRNFQGYSTHAECDLVGLGVTAIGTVDGNFYQNHKNIERYDAAIDAGGLAVARGLVPDADDRLRRAVIMQLICRFELDFADFEARFGIDFPAYFSAELDRLRTLQADGLLGVDHRGIRVSDAGRLLIRNVCMVFDRHISAARSHGPQIRYSRAI